jgi:hypothetical protein
LTKLRDHRTYKELPKTLRELNAKNRKTGTSSAVDEKAVAELERKVEVMRREAQPLRKVVERILVVAAERGDKTVLCKVAEELTTSLINLVINCVNITEHNSPLLKAVLKILSHSTTLTTSRLPASFLSARDKLIAQGDEEVKPAVKKIMAVVKENDSNQPPEPPPSAAESPTPSSKASSGKISQKPITKTSSPSKRPLEDDTEQKSAKKVATIIRPPISRVKPPASQASSATASTTSSSVTKPRIGSGLLPGKSRPPVKSSPQKQEPAKPDAPKADPIKNAVKSERPLGSAPIKSEVAKPKPAPPSAATTSEPIKPVRVKKADPPKAEPAQQGPSKFAALMAEIYEPKVAKPPSPTPTPSADVSETPDERDRRLKKEKRRKLNLRVTWKEGEELTSVRIFHKEAAEDEGLEGNLVRDAGDDRAEGKLLKQSRSGEIRPWEDPMLIDFTIIPLEQRQKCFVTRGGTRTFHTDQQKFMEERERTELMVVYTDHSDIPPTPKSPPLEPAQLDVSKGTEVPRPKNAQWDEFQQRVWDVKVYGPSQALYNALQRNEKKASLGAASHNRAMEMINKVPILASKMTNMNMKRWDPEAREARDQFVLDTLRSDKVKNWIDPEPYDANNEKTSRRSDYGDPKVQAAANAIEDLVATLKGKPAPPTEPPAWQQDPDRRSEWWRGFNQDKQREEDRRKDQVAASLSSLSAAYGNPSAQPSPYGQPITSQPQNSYAQFYQPPQPQPTSDANATLAALASLTGGFPPPQPQPVAPAAQDQVQALLAALNPSSKPEIPPAPPAFPNVQQQDPSQQAYMLQLAQWFASQQQQQQPASNQAQAGTGGGDTQSYTSGFTDPARNQQYSGSSQAPSNDYNQRDSQDYGGRSGGGNRSRDRGGRRGQTSYNNNQADVPDHLRGINRSLIGTKQCAFWAKGQCAKGDKCTFRHD